MIALADRITTELLVLIGEPISDVWRAANMQVFGFGELRQIVNRYGEEVEVTDINLHVQCRWRLVDDRRILFGRDDLLRPADEDTPVDDFDWDKEDSVLDVLHRKWIAKHKTKPLRVINAIGDNYGGFRMEFEEQIFLEAFPCNSNCEEDTEHWRLLGHRSDGSHFVIGGYGVLDDHV